MDNWRRGSFNFNFWKKNNLGGGILIGDTLEKSEINNTHISLLNGYNLFQNQEYLILGSINFHQTKVKLNNVRFSNIFLRML